MLRGGVNASVLEVYNKGIEAGSRDIDSTIKDVEANVHRSSALEFLSEEALRYAKPLSEAKAELRKYSDAKDANPNMQVSEYRNQVNQLGFNVAAYQRKAEIEKVLKKYGGDTSTYKEQRSLNKAVKTITDKVGKGGGELWTRSLSGEPNAYGKGRFYEFEVTGSKGSQWVKVFDKAKANKLLIELRTKGYKWKKGYFDNEAKFE